MVPLLHCLIMIGNNLHNKFCDMVIRIFFDKLSAEEVKFVQELVNYKIVNVTSVKEGYEFD
jgi:hypothetical protein